MLTRDDKRQIRSYTAYLIIYTADDCDIPIVDENDDNEDREGEARQYMRSLARRIEP